MSDALTVRCIECKAEVTLRQPRDHSEYLPSGHCPKCGLFHYVSYTLDGDMQVNASRQMIGAA